MNKREFISAVRRHGRLRRAQQPVMPVIGFLNSGSPEGLRYLTAACHQRLNDAGFVEA